MATDAHLGLSRRSRHEARAKPNTLIVTHNLLQSCLTELADTIIAVCISASQRLTSKQSGEGRSLAAIVAYVGQIERKLAARLSVLAVLLDDLLFVADDLLQVNRLSLRRVRVNQVATRRLNLSSSPLLGLRSNPDF